MQKTNGSGLRLLFIRMLVRMRLFGECYYINGPDTLPPPLKKAEEQAVFEELKQGKESARQTLIVQDVYKRKGQQCCNVEGRQSPKGQQHGAAAKQNQLVY